MRIEAKTSADVVHLTVKRNQKHDGTMAYVDLEVGIKKEDAKKFGADFEDLAFRLMRELTDKETGAVKLVHLQDKITPSKKHVMHERHVIVLDGNKLTEQPELINIKTIDGEARVVATYRIPVPVTQTALLTKLMGKVNGLVGVEFNPEQQLIDLKQKREQQAAK